MSKDTIESKLRLLTLPPRSMKKSEAVRELRKLFPETSRAHFIDGFRAAFSATYVQASTYYHRYFLTKSGLAPKEQLGPRSKSLDPIRKNEHLQWSTEIYSVTKFGETISSKVFACRITSPDAVLTNKKNNPILAALKHEGLADRIGLYFYRFENIDKLVGVNAFSKIGEVSRKAGIQKRFENGWLTNGKNTDTYHRKPLYEDVCRCSEDSPIIFVFYEQNAKYCHPKIDEIRAFTDHVEHFKVGTRNPEKMNGNTELGEKLIWRQGVFAEVLAMKFPSGKPYFGT